MAVDEAHGVISHVQADFADQRDCTLLPSIIAPLHQRLTTQGLPLREVAGRLSKRYSASRRDCRLCPRKPTCAPKSTKRKITRTAYDAQYRRALARQQSRPGRGMRRLRQRTIEPVFGSLLQYYGLRRVNTRGRSSAHKTMLLTAIAFNLKKLLKHQPLQTQCRAIALPVPPPEGQLLRCWRARYRYCNRLGNGD